MTSNWGLEKCKLKQYIDNKIENYEEQDKVAGREITSDYANFNWFDNKFEKNPVCMHCQNSLEFMIDEDKIYHLILHSTDWITVFVTQKISWYYLAYTVIYHR